MVVNFSDIFNGFVLLIAGIGVRGIFRMNDNISSIRLHISKVESVADHLRCEMERWRVQFVQTSDELNKFILRVVTLESKVDFLIQQLKDDKLN